MIFLKKFLAISKKYITKRRILSFVKKVLEWTTSIILSVLFCTNSQIVFGNMGFVGPLVALADTSRSDNEYAESLKWYKKLADKNNEYSPYAFVAIGEIRSRELENKDFDKAFEAFAKAVSLSEDIKVLNSALRFVIEQIDLYNEELQEYGNSKTAIDMLSDELTFDEGRYNIDFVVDLFNKIYKVNSKQFVLLNVEFPVNRKSLKSFLAKDTISISYEKWEYVSTRYSYNGSESFTNDEEKLLLVDSWQELIEPDSFSTTTVYKYYRYSKKIVEEEVKPTELVMKNTFVKDRLFLNDYIDSKEKSTKDTE